jgi:prophage DNA circulation protein
MASWLDYLLPCSFRGVPFNVVDSARTGGRRIALHDYPYRSSPWPEDLGLADKQFHLSGYLVGDDVAAQEDAMHAVCGLSGAGLLVHPTLGPITVTLLSFSSQINAQDGRVCRLEMEFVQGQDSIFPSAITDALSAISGAADVAILAASGDYAAALALTGASGGSFASSVLGITGGVTSAVAPFVSTATTIAGDAGIVTAAVSGLVGNYGRYGNAVAGSNPASTITSVLAGVTTAKTAIGTAAGAVTSLAALV